MLTRLGGILVAAWYLAIVWYGMEEGYIRARGLEIDEYAIVAGLMGLAWLVATQIASIIITRVTRGERGTAGAFNGMALGVIAVLVMLPLHLMYGPRHMTGEPFALDEVSVLGLLAVAWFIAIDLPRLAFFRLGRLKRVRVFTVANFVFLGAVAGIAWVAQLTVDGELRGFGGDNDTPAEALMFVMSLGLVVGVILSVILELPRALVARTRSEPEADAPVGFSRQNEEQATAVRDIAAPAPTHAREAARDAERKARKERARIVKETPTVTRT